MVSAPETAAAFLNSHIDQLAAGYDVDLVANFDTSIDSRVSTSAHHISVRIERTISPLQDLRSLMKLRRALKRGQYDIVHSVTPKAGLLAMLASASLGVRHRIHWFTGQVWVTRTGIARWGLKTLDRLIAWLSTRVLVDSPSQLDFLVREGIIDRSRATVLGSGSICGVDTQRFCPNPRSRQKVRLELGIDEESVVVLYVGRINRDKGILDLAAALPEINVRAEICLLLVGKDEEGLVPIVDSTLRTSGTRYVYFGHSDSPEEIMAASDIFCMPSHREGFGLSVIEAAATELPCVASSIYGLTDAVADGVTGMLFQVGNTGEMATCLERLINDGALRVEMGKQARRRVTEEFLSDRLITALELEYQKLLSEVAQESSNSD